MSERAAEDEPARLHADHHLDVGRAVPAGQVVDHGRPGRRVLEERRDVPEEDAFGWEILDISDLRAQLGQLHGGSNVSTRRSRAMTKKALREIGELDVS